MTSIKHKRDSMKVELNLKMREIERYKYMLADVKKEIEDLLSHRGEHDKKINELKMRFQEQGDKTEGARENQAVYEEMFKIRHVNLILFRT